jgi:DNA invertase Pin-like site-specific DNA recombinase
MGDRLRIALYARVSKGIYQNPENQLLELRRWAQQAGVEVEGEYVDEISSRDTRPQKEAILKKLRLGVIDGVAFYALDRWGQRHGRADQRFQRGSLARLAAYQPQRGPKI